MAGLKLLYKKITTPLSEIPEVKVVILYGSFARSEQNSRSDIDLFIVVSKKSIDKIQNTIIEIEHKLGVSIQPTIRTEKELYSTDSGLLQNIFQEGKILFLREYFDFPVTFLLEHKPFLIFKFDISTLPQNKKTEFNRELYGYKDRKYKYDGFLSKIDGAKLSAGCILIPYKNRKSTLEFFHKKGTNLEEIKIWK